MFSFSDVHAMLFIQMSQISVVSKLCCEHWSFFIIILKTDMEMIFPVL